jgi:hypothetical protein
LLQDFDQLSKVLTVQCNPPRSPRETFKVTFLTLVKEKSGLVAEKGQDHPHHRPIFSLVNLWLQENQKSEIVKVRGCPMRDNLLKK